MDWGFEMNTCPGTDLLLLLDHELIDDTDTHTELNNHVEQCEHCQRRKKQLSLVKALAPLPAAPEGFFQRIQDQIDREKEEAKQGPETLIHIKLQCTFCKGKLESKNSVYCGTCLAPYHKDCFNEYGRCAVQGCDEKRFVQTQVVVPKPRRIWPFAVLAICGIGGGLAALNMQSTLPPQSQTRLTKAETNKTIISRYVDEIVDYDLSSSPTMALATTKSGKKIDLLKEQREHQFRIFDVKDLVSDKELKIQSSNLDELPFEILQEAPEFLKLDGRKSWMGQYAKVLATRRVTINFSETPVVDVVAFLQDITGLNLSLAKDVRGETLKISVRLRTVRLIDALAYALPQAGLTATLKNESIVVHHQTRAHRAWVDQYRRVRKARRTSFQFTASLSAAEIISAIKEETGIKNWAAPAEMNYDSLGILIAKNKPVILNKVDRALYSLRRNKEAPESQKYWFQGASSVVIAPSQVRISEAIELLDKTRVSLKLSDSKLSDIVKGLNSVTDGELRFRLDPELLKSNVTVSYKVENVSLSDALVILTKLTKTVYDVDRVGVYIRRKSSPSLENLLFRGADQLFSKSAVSTEVQRRLKNQRLDFNFNDTPVADSINFLRDITGLNFVVTRDAAPLVDRKGSFVNLRIRNVSVENALNLMLNQVGLSWRSQQGVVLIIAPSASPLSADLKRRIPEITGRLFNKKPFVAQSLGDFARQLEAATKLHVVFPDGVQSPARVTIPVGSSVGEALASVEMQAHLESKFGDIGAQRVPFIALRVASEGPILRAISLEKSAKVAKTSMPGLNNALDALNQRLTSTLTEFHGKKALLESSTDKAALAKILSDFTRTLAVINADRKFLSEVVAIIERKNTDSELFKKTMAKVRGRYRETNEKIYALPIRWKATKSKAMKEIKALEAELRRLDKIDEEELGLDAIQAHNKKMVTLRGKYDAALKQLNRKEKINKLETAKLQSQKAQLKQRIIELDRRRYPMKSIENLFGDESQWRPLIVKGFGDWRREARRIADFQVQHRFQFGYDCPAKVPNKKNCQCKRKD